MFDAIRRRVAGLRARYAEPHRAYHTQSHVDAMLAGLQHLGGAVAHPDTIELAIWYHDAIYDPAATDNEPRSAALLRTELTGLAHPEILAQAEALISWTADHRLPTGLPAQRHHDASLFLDLDMAILGSPPDAFDAYERAIAAEYLPVHGQARFAAGRTAFLQQQLTRPRLFHSDLFHHRHDQAARRNIQRALAALPQPTGPQPSRPAPR